MKNTEMQSTLTPVLESDVLTQHADDHSHDDDHDLGIELKSLVSFEFNEGVGTAISDSADTSPDGIVKGSDATWSLGTIDDKGFAIALGGTSSISVPDTVAISQEIKSTYSVSLWFKADDIEAAGKQVLYEQGGTVRGLNIYLDNGDLYVGAWNEPTQESGWNGTWLKSEGLDADHWHFVTVTLDGTNTVQSGALRAYLDGIPFAEGQDQGDASQLWKHGSGIGIGGVERGTKFHDTGDFKGNGLQFKGLVDDVQVYDTTLSSADVMAVYEARTPEDIHTDDSGKMAEHEALLELVPRDAATHIAVKSGSWFDPTIWQGGVVPGNDAKVLIVDGVEVEYDQESDARLFTVRVDGHLEFASDQNTKMVVDTFIVAPSGHLTIGTEENPVQGNKTARIVIADNGRIDIDWDPTQLSRGLISHGSVEIVGQEKTTHLKVAVDPLAGQNTLTLEDVPQNWQVGDRLVLTGTDNLGGTWKKTSYGYDDTVWNGTQDEELTIAAINGNVITLDRPLLYNHTTPQSDLKASVANYSRNVIFESEYTGRPENLEIGGNRTQILRTPSEADLDLTRRGHVMLMHSPNIEVRNAEFFELGRTDKSRYLRDHVLDANGFPVLDESGEYIPTSPEENTNQRGRYSLHVHKTGVESEPAIISGNAVWGSPGWGFVHHDSNAIFEQNASYETYGAGFVAEAGNETGTWSNNIAIKAEGTLEDEKDGARVNNNDIGHNGTGFWFQSRIVGNDNNIAAGVRRSGFTYQLRGNDVELDPDTLPIPFVARYDNEAQPSTPPIHDFFNNETIASGRALTVIKANQNQKHDARSVIDGITGWEVTNGVHFQYTAHYTLRDALLIGTGAKDSRGIDFAANIEDFVVVDSEVSGFTTGANLSKHNTFEADRVLENSGYVLVNTTFANVTTPIANFDPNHDRILSNADLKPGLLNVAFDSRTDLVYSQASSDRKVLFEGTKTDSLGSIDLAFGTDTYLISFEGLENLLKEGYYTDGKGTRFLVAEDAIADRLTGDLRRFQYAIPLASDVNTGSAPALGLYSLAPDVRYSMNEGVSTVTAEVAGRTPNAVLKNGVTWTNDTPTGSPAALVFDGVNDIVTIPDSPQINLTEITDRTVSIWFQASATNTNRQVIYEEGGTTSGLNIYLEQGRLYAGAWADSEARWVTSSQVVQGNGWHHVAFVLDGSATGAWASNWMWAALDGQPFSGTQSTNFGVTVPVHSQDIGIGGVVDGTRFASSGSFNGSGEYFKGAIDDLQIFNKALQPFEVQVLFSGTIGS